MIASLLQRAVGGPLAAAGLALAGCATAERAPDLATQPVDETPSSEAERLAHALVEAEQAFARGDKRALTAALGRLDAVGATPLDENMTEIQRWRDAADPQPPMRGRPLGPGFRSGELPPGESEQIEQVFLSGERASVALSSPGATRLTLEVQGRRDEPVCRRGGKAKHCRWGPLGTERYRMRSTNPGKDSARYALVVD